jgi:hypothetical protein
MPEDGRRPNLGYGKTKQSSPRAKPFAVNLKGAACLSDFTQLDSQS